MIIKKLYVDIEACHNEVIRKNEKWKFYDYKGWNLKNGSIIGVLGLGIDNSKMIKKELIFKQFLIDTNSWMSNATQLFGLFDKADLIVTFNGRNFDLPCILENFLDSDSYKRMTLAKIMGDKGKDRDLMDLYILKRGPWIKGGLRVVAKKLEVTNKIDKLIDIDNDNIDIEKECRIFLDWKGFDKESDERKEIMTRILRKNENDIRILPLIEEKMGLLWRGRTNFDLFHKKWDAFYEALEKEEENKVNYPRLKAGACQ